LTLPFTFPNPTPSISSSSLSLTIAANQSVEIQTASSSSSLSVGWADLSASGPLEGYGVFAFNPLTGPSSQGTVTLDARLSSSLVLPYDNTNGSRTGIAIANQSSSLTSITAVLFDQSGAQLGSSLIALPALGHTSFFVTDRFSQSVNRTGIIRFQNPAGNVTGIGLLFYPGGAFTSLPIIQ